MNPFEDRISYVLLYDEEEDFLVTGNYLDYHKLQTRALHMASTAERILNDIDGKIWLNKALSYKTFLMLVIVFQKFFTIYILKNKK